jgi:hypothetical protein
MEALEHLGWRPVKPPLVHVHGQKRVHQGVIGRCRSTDMVSQRFIGAVYAKPEVVDDTARDRRFSGTASPADPANVAQSIPEVERVSDLVQLDPTVVATAMPPTPIIMKANRLRTARLMQSRDCPPTQALAWERNALVSPVAAQPVST